MIFNIILFLLIVVVAFERKLDKKIPIVVGIVLVLIAGLRFEYGNDYATYQSAFNTILSITDVAYMEIGYRIVMLALKCCGFDFWVLIMIIAITSISLKIITFNKYSIMPMITCIIYFLMFFRVQDMEQIRTGLAAAICLYALKYVYSKEVWKFTGFVLCACLIHISAIVFIIVYFIGDIKMNMKKILIVLCVFAVVGSIDIMAGLDWVNQTFIFSDFLQSKINAYSQETLNIISLSILLRMIMLILFYRFVYNENCLEHRVYLNGYVMILLLFLGFRSIEILATRTAVYFFYFELFMFPYLIENLFCRWAQFKSLRSSSNNEMEQIEKKDLKFMKLETLLLASGIVILSSYYFYSFWRTSQQLEYYIYHTIFG